MTPVMRLVSKCIRLILQKGIGVWVVVWVDICPLATGVNENIVADLYWLHPDRNAWYIKFVDLDAILRALNLALQWKGMLHLITDSACTHLCIVNTLTNNFAGIRVLW